MIKKNPNIKEFDLSTFKGGRNTHGHQSELNPNAGKYGPGQTPYLDNFHTVLVNFNKEVPRDFLLVFTYSLADGCILFINSYNFEEKFYFKNVLCYVVMWNLFTVGSLQFSIEVL